MYLSVTFLLPTATTSLRCTAGLPSPRRMPSGGAYHQQGCRLQSTGWSQTSQQDPGGCNYWVEGLGEEDSQGRGEATQGREGRILAVHARASLHLIKVGAPETPFIPSAGSLSEVYSHLLAPSPTTLTCPPCAPTLPLQIVCAAIRHRGRGQGVRRGTNAGAG